jgi:threonylcarbamoyladenosine tRNA methylthiotransferase MtaB
MNNSKKTFLSVNFGCRVNMAETNQWSQTLIDQGLTHSKEKSPDIILVNTCAITKKGEKESINKVKFLSHQYPQAQIYITGCASFDKIKNLPNITLFKNNQKEELLNHLKSLYTPEIKDKFSHTHRYLLKVQSGCTQFCSYCIVPFKRNYLWSLSINDAINTVNKAIDNGYQEVIITGVNLDQYKYGFSNLVDALLKETDIKLISFGSIPINCIDQKFLDLLSTFSFRLSNFLHIPVQSGSDKILSLMHRPYTKSDILEKFNKIKKIIPHPVKGEARGGFLFGTDIIVGFPTETDQDFQETLDLCQQIGFSKIHTFPFSPRPNTKARIIFETSSKISKEKLKERSKRIRTTQLLANPLTN